MKKTSIVLFMLATSYMLQAQQLKEKISYAGSFQLGTIVGRAYTTFTAQTIQGIRYKNFETGAGVALDPYGFRTVPVFGHFGYTLYCKKNSPFAYADAGVSIPWNNDALPEKYENNDDWHSLYTGFYAETGLGYRINLNKHNALTIHLGYSYKQFKYSEINYVWNGSSSIQQKDMFIFDYRRLAFRLGFNL